MAVALTDGNPSSLKALDLAFVPSLLVKHENDQLIVIHGWNDVKDPAQVGNLAAVSGAIDHVAKSRVAQNTLNYKVEMIRLQEGKNDRPAPESSPTPTPASPTKDEKKGAKGKKAAEESKPPPVPVAAETFAEGAGGENEIDEEFAVAKQVVEYVASRCKHHDISQVVLGVGNAQQGKSVAVGSVCKELVAQYRSQFHLFCMKASGPTVRPTAAMRMMVLVVPGSSLDHLKYALSISSQAKSDRIGVMIVVNNGKEKPPEGVSYLGEEEYDENGVMTVAETTRRCTSLLADFGLTDAPNNELDGGSPSQAAAESFPLINHVSLEPTNSYPTPTIEESGLQLIKIVGGWKVDFFVLPPPKEGLGENFVQLCLQAPKPHTLLVKD